MQQASGRMVTAIRAFGGALSLLVAAGLLVYEGVWDGRQSGAQRKSLSKSAQSEVEALLNARKEIVASMPSHPLSREVLQDLLAICRFDMGSDRGAALRLLTEHFRQSPLGLYALQTYCDDTRSPEDAPSSPDDKIEYCRHLCDIYPDSSASTMALDYVLSHSPDKLQVCDLYIEASSRSRLGVFALMRKGDIYYEKGDEALAALCYLDVWQKDPSRGKKLFPRLQDIWGKHGFWVYHGLFPEKYLDGPMLNPVKERAIAEIRTVSESTPETSARALSRLWDASDKAAEGTAILRDTSIEPLWRAKGGLAAARTLTDRQEREAATETVHRVHEVLSENKSATPAYADLCLAAFLQCDSSAKVNLQSHASVALLSPQRGRLTGVQRALAGLCLDSLTALSPDEQACFVRLMADRYAQEMSLAETVETLKRACAVKGACLQISKDNVLELARVYAKEWDAQTEAARTCVEFCSKFDAASEPEDVLLAAGMYYFHGRAYNDALDQFNRLTVAGDAGARTAAEFMVGVCYLQKGDQASALDSFQNFAARHPDSDFAARALYLEGACQLSSQRYGEARQCFEDLLNRFPRSEYAERAKDYATRLANLEAKK